MSDDNQNLQKSGFEGDAGRRKQRRGFAVVDKKRQRKFASQGGSKTAKTYGKEYMREIGRKGGKNSRRIERELRGQVAQPRELPFDLRTVVNLVEMAQRELRRNPDASDALLTAALRLLTQPPHEPGPPGSMLV